MSETLPHEKSLHFKIECFVLLSFCNRICITHTDLLIGKHLMTLSLQLTILCTAVYILCRYLIHYSCVVPQHTVSIGSKCPTAIIVYNMKPSQHVKMTKPWMTCHINSNFHPAAMQLDTHDHSIIDILVYDQNLHFLQCGPQLYRGTSTDVSTVAMLNYL
jgi:hypothetical protein